MRAGEWWDFKLVPILSAFYATALTLGAPASALWLPGVTLLLSIAVCAAYVSLINDVTDRAVDAAAGKRNRIAGRSGRAIALLLAVPIGAGLGFSWLWRADPLVLWLYLAAWLAFTLYSVPPFRFKNRGLLGVLADASGAHLFPTLLALVLACRGAGRAVSADWVLAVGVWAFACGLRGILWHQLTDLEQDRLVGLRTFARSHSPEIVSRLGAFLVFPLELAALGVMLAKLPSPIPAALLAGYAAFAVARTLRGDINNIIVAPRPRYRVVLNEYYEVFLPIAVLSASALRHPLDWSVLGAHLLLFRSRPRQVLADAWHVARGLLPSPRG